MSLATRCIHCGTVFRVVEDQLKVSEGWVRCGRCNEVFNAVEGLFDLDREPPPDWSPPSRPPGAPAEARPAQADAPVRLHDPELVDRLDAELVAGRIAAASSFGADAVSPADDSPPAAAPTAEPMQEPVPEPVPQPAPRRSRRRIPADAAPPATEAPAEPEFLRRAQQQDRWRRSPHRAALAATAVVLLLLLGVQIAVHQRDLLAARVPTLAPALAVLCSGFGCKIGPPRRIDALAVESTALARTTTPDVFRLSVTLRNRDPYALLLPSIDLALTDSSGALVARRVLSPADFRVATPVIAAGAEQTLTLPLTAGAGRVSGYTVEIFYP
jgi:predicted Zn finger-like uncharacterized protein